MMRAAVMSKGEFNKWLEDNYKAPEEREIIMAQIKEQAVSYQTGTGKYSNGKLY